MNRLTDALYMVRFKVRPGVRASDPEQPGGGGIGEKGRGYIMEQTHTLFHSGSKPSVR